MKPLLLFALFFLIGAALAIGVRSVTHRPYAEVAPAATTPAPAAAPAPVDHANHGDHAGHAGAPAAPSAPPAPPAPVDATAAIGNTICPECGMDVDPEVAPVPTAHGLVGIGCAPCAPKIARDPVRYGEAARENRRAK